MHKKNGFGYIVNVYRCLFYYFVVSLFFYMFVSQYVNVLEDLYYVFRYDVPTKSYVPIESITDVIRAQCHDYMKVNGRFLIHVVVQYLCSMSWTIQIFFIISSIFFSLLVHGISRIIKKHGLYYQESDKFVITALILLLVPVIGRTFLGHISFVLNYLWVSTIFVWTYLFISSNINKSNIWISISFFFLALIVGCLQESFSIPVSAFLFFYSILNYKKLNLANKIVIIGFFIGTAICVLAPGNFARMSVDYLTSSDAKGIHKWIGNFISIVKTVPVFDIFVVLNVLLILFKRNEYLNFICQYKYVYLMICVSLFFPVFVAFTASHQFCFMSLLIVYLIVEMTKYFDFLSTRVKKGIWCCVLMSILLVIYIPSYFYRQEVCTAWNEMIESAKNTHDGYVRADNLYSLTHRLGGTIYEDFTNFSYAQLHLDCCKHDEIISAYATAGKDLNHVKTIIPASPSYIRHLFDSGKNSTPVVTYDKKSDCYYVRVKKGQENSTEITYQYEMTPYMKLVSLLKSSFSSDIIPTYSSSIEKDVRYITDNSYNYYIYQNKHYSSFDVVSKD